MIMVKMIGVTLCVIIFLCITCCGAAIKAKSKSVGPYVTRLIRIENCKQPSHPYDENPGCIYYGELYNTSKKQNLIRGNLTVMRETKNVMMTMKCYILENGQWKLIYFVSKVGCKSRWLGAVMLLFGVHYENCSIEKGVHSFQNIEMNQVDHLWASTREYGRMLMKSESYINGKTWVCVEAETEVIPA